MPSIVTYMRSSTDFFQNQEILFKIQHLSWFSPKQLKKEFKMLIIVWKKQKRIKILLYVTVLKKRFSIVPINLC